MSGLVIVNLAALVLVLQGLLFSSAVTTPNRLVNGEIADADEVNANFDAMAAAINDNNDRIDKALDRIAELESRVRGLEIDIDVLDPDLFERLKDRIDGLEDLLDVLVVRDVEFDPQVGPLPTLVATGVNVQILNGDGATDTLNGLGNLILGYNESPKLAARKGSHNLVLGERNNYAAAGGIVGGVDNEISGAFSSVLSGAGNLARGIATAITGGTQNFTDGTGAVVSGGADIGETRDSGWSTSGFASP